MSQNKEMIKNCRWCARAMRGNADCYLDVGQGCENFMSYYPTPKQLKAETGIEWPDNARVWLRNSVNEPWRNHSYGWVKMEGSKQAVCAICPVSPPDDWRPEND
jgi:hypothetical protein